MAKRKHIPERKCVSCGKRLPKQDLVRIVRSPQGSVSIDSTGKSAGRGAYLCRTSGCWEKGLNKRGLERSLDLSLSGSDLQGLEEYYQELVEGAVSSER